ncbi:tyrosine-type recombinase/integrase [Bacillus salitolerans]|uniref:Tyrosine-type recombinase/integrase n=1 Tax=Bacillus salitolerans TaxID=1437434 RepID=A0ABW4LNY9_9BACI
MPYGFSNYLNSATNEDGDKHYKELTITTYLKTVEMFKAYLLANEEFSHIELKDAKTKHINSFLKSKLEENSLTTINKLLSSLKVFYDYLEKSQQIIIDPACKIKSFKVKELKPKNLDYEVLLTIRDSMLNKHHISLQAKVLFILGIRGLRFSDFSIKHSDVSHIDNRIEIQIGKRKVILKNAEAELFAEYYYESLLNGSEYLFAARNENSRSPIIDQSTLYYQLQKVFDEYEEIETRPNLTDIRHAYVYYLRMKKKYVIDQLSAELGIHKNRTSDLVKETIERYNGKEYNEDNIAI